MFKTTIQIEGMSCPMCEAHINDVIRNNFKVKKLSTSHKAGISGFISETEPDRALLSKVIGDTGYTVNGISILPYEKKRRGLFGSKKS